MAFEIFTRKVTRSITPSITLSKLGRIALNKSATTVLEKNAVEFVLLLWDGESRVIGIRPITKKDSRAYPVKYGSKGNGAGFSAKTFLDFINVDYSESRVLPASWEADGSMLTAEVPVGIMKNDKQGLLEMDTPQRRASRSS